MYCTTSARAIVIIMVTKNSHKQNGEANSDGNTNTSTNRNTSSKGYGNSNNRIASKCHGKCSSKPTRLTIAIVLIIMTKIK